MGRIWTGRHIEAEVLYSKAGIATQILLTDIEKKEHILMDCGDGVVRDLIERQIDLNLIKGILISHGHPDHIGGIYSLLSAFKLFNVKQEITIYAPTPCWEFLRMLQTYLEIYKGRYPFTLNYHELKPGVLEGLGNFVIKPFKALHYENMSVDDPKEKPAFGYRVTLNDETVVYSGDTLPCPELEKEVEGVDLAIIEATYNKPIPESLSNHLQYEYAEYVGKSAKNYFLIHQL